MSLGEQLTTTDGALSPGDRGLDPTQGRQELGQQPQILPDQIGETKLREFNKSEM